ncbi:hypothetical protein RB614_15795 [Phytohabitans sp. ZYX-F-186]|uniref:DNA-directed RNA polymerase sigma-70 factor n=1 Tax=Phytohabitans maris TaxID=3071409 RepID=A0ABU0ZI49_9ACTN|nr:hypothetical protein [Phytohabitans sp. ZYX-F-186]MDQ7905975.1 hypothetical protein [Phytohabitans sp. ZYX-F-186]
MDQPDDDLAPPDDDDLTPTDNGTTRRARWQLYTPLPLQYLREQAEAMTDIGVPGRMLGVQPADVLLPMDTLRALLDQQTVPLPVRDAVWRYLITNAIEQRGRWYTYVVGVAALRLIEKAHFLTPGGKNGDYENKRQVQQHLAVGFLAELFKVSPEDERIGDRIIWRTVYRAKQAWWANREVDWPPLPGQPEPELEPPVDDSDDGPPADDELPPVLRELVGATAHVKPSRSDRRPKVTAEDAALVALCSLFGRTIGEAAHEIGVSADAARAKLPRVKRAVFTLLASRYLKNKHPHWMIDPLTDRAAGQD